MTVAGFVVVAGVAVMAIVAVRRVSMARVVLLLGVSVAMAVVTDVAINKCTFAGDWAVVTGVSVARMTVVTVAGFVTVA